MESNPGGSDCSPLSVSIQYRPHTLLRTRSAQTARYIFVTIYMAVLQRDVVCIVECFTVNSSNSVLQLTLASRWVEPLLNTVISCLVRGFFIHRTYKTTKSLLLVSPLIVFQVVIFVWQIWLVVDVATHYMTSYIVITNVACELPRIYRPIRTNRFI
jgi:hypothetical protein